MTAENTNEKHVLLLHNIRSVHNVGAIFRTADAIGISKIFISGYTPAPVDRFGRIRQDFHKAALDSENSVEWEVVDDCYKNIQKLKEDGYTLIGLEQGDDVVDYKSVNIDGKTAVVIGSEVGGMDAELQKECDVLAEIPMNGIKDSLNVSVATGIFLYRLFDK